MDNNNRIEEEILPPLSQEERASADLLRQGVHAKLQRLKSINPVILDLSIREPSVGAATGHLVEHKLELFKLAKEVGFTDILLATFNVAIPDEIQTDDVFCQLLKEQGTDLHGCFAFTGLGGFSNDAFIPGNDLQKLIKYGIPNTIIDVDLGNEWIGDSDDARKLFLLRLVHTIDWINCNVTGDNGKPRIYINYRDLPDAYEEDWLWVAQVTKLLGTTAIEAVTYEDPKGALFPFQIAGITALLKKLIPAKMYVLVHIHTGNGMESASVIEALLAGADGVWSGLSKEAAYIGHASTAELLANLKRIKNIHVDQYNLQCLSGTVARMTRINLDEHISRDSPIFGENAYCSMLSVFEQNDKPMDLNPKDIGRHYHYRIAPVASDHAVIAKRLQEVMGINDNEELKMITEKMRRLMRQDLINGRRLIYDEASNLKSLYKRAMDELELTSGQTAL